MFDPARAGGRQVASGKKTSLSSVRFISLRLESFGVYGDPVQFTFPSSLGVDVRPNEKGKSTVVSGLQAVLFGLPHSSDPDKFGAARFRSWEGKGAFQGALDFSAGDRRYRIQRDFETHVTKLFSLDDGDLLLFEGEANPWGQTSGIQRYRDVLGDLLPVVELELFQSVYCVEQPIPTGDRITHEVQRLLTGAGVAAGRGVLSQLFQSFRAISRKTGAAGIHELGKRPTDQKTDGRLEELQARLEQLDEQRRQGESQFLRVHTLEQSSRSLSNELAGITDQKKALRHVLECIESYRYHSTGWERLRLRKTELERALKLYEQNEASRVALTRTLEYELPHLSGTPRDFGTAIQRAVASHRRRVSSEQAVAVIRRESEDVWSEMEQLRGKLESNADLAGRPEDFWQVLRRRREIWNQLQSTRKALDDVQRRLDGFEREFESAPWASLPKPPQSTIRTMRQASEALLSKWKRWIENRDHRQVLKSLINRWEPLRDIPADEISSSEISRQELRRLRDTATEEEERLKERMYAVHASHNRRLRRWRLLAAGGSLLSGTSVSSLILILTSSLPAAIAIGVVVAVGLWFFFRNSGWDRNEDSQLTDDLREAEQRRRKAEEALEAFTTRWNAVLMSLNLPHVDEGGLTQLMREHRDRQAALQKLDFLKLVKNQTENDLFGKPLSDEADATAVVPWETYPQEIHDLKLFAEAMADEEPETLTELIDWLGAIDEETWKFWEEEAARWSADRAKVDNLAATRDLHLGRGATPGIPQLEEELMRLDEMCRPFDTSADLEELEPRWREVRATEEKLRSLTSRSEELSRSLSAAEAELAGLAAEWKEWDKVLGPQLERAGGDPEGLLTQWRNAQEIRIQIREAEHLRDGALAILQGVDSTIEGLRRGLGEVENEADGHFREMKNLEQQSDAVTEYASIESGEEKDRYRKRLEDDLAARKASEAEVEEKLKEVQIDLKSLARSDIPTLAQLDLEIADLRQQIVRLESHRDVILEAWSTMKSVVDDLPRTFGPALARNITELFGRITMKQGRRVDLTPELELAVFDGGNPCAMEQLSQGARDQLALSVRMAVASQVGMDVPLPILLDDPFVNFDEDRLERLRQTLVEMAKERQILLWTHDPRCSGWGEAIRREAP